jgi:hypothetical protein
MKNRKTSWKILIFLVACLSWYAPLLSESEADIEKDRMAICHSCFWTYHPEGLKKNLTDFYKDYQNRDFFISAEAYYLMGRMIPNESMIRAAFAQYKYALEIENDRFRKTLLNEIIGMLAEDAGIEPEPYFKKASRLAKKMKMKWRSKLMKSLSRGDFNPTFGDYRISKDLAVPTDAKYFILGQSSIKIPARAKIGVQLERTFRDWLSSQFQYDFLKSYSVPENVLDYHEGARLGDLMKYTGAVPVPLTGTILAYKEGTWYAPDENGIFRFKVLDDKVQYPTTKQYKNIALMIDTHGISAIVEQAVREGVDLVIACGDNPAKAQAAAYLADRGIPVYFPCDREIGMLVGYEGNAVVLGTAPIRKVDSGAIIGDQPVRFSIKEPIVIQDIQRDSAARYYDSASRYFIALNSYVPLNLHTVKIEGEKETYKVIMEAVKIGAKAIGVRVRYEEDYDAVKKWLQQSEENRAVLFHSAPYEPGYRLFFEFPEQVTFGDPRPQFSNKK